METGDAGKWGEGGENINRTGGFSSGVRAGRTLTGQGDSAYFRSRCRKLVRPTEKFKKSNCLL